MKIRVKFVLTIAASVSHEVSEHSKSSAQQLTSPSEDLTTLVTKFKT